MPFKNHANVKIRLKTPPLKANIRPFSDQFELVYRKAELAVFHAGFKANSQYCMLIQGFFQEAEPNQLPRIYTENFG
jgi:hypothetical protein